MFPLLFSILALIIALAAFGASAVLYRATMAARTSTPGEVLVRLSEIEQEWASTLEGNARFLKRLAQREKRAEKTAQDALEPTNGSEPGSKAQLRMIARQRGLGA